MRVLVAGATGVIGSGLVPLLGAVGHEVIGQPVRTQYGLQARTRGQPEAAPPRSAELLTADQDGSFSPPCSRHR